MKNDVLKTLSERDQATRGLFIPCSFKELIDYSLLVGRAPDFLGHGATNLMYNGRPLLVNDR